MQKHKRKNEEQQPFHLSVMAKVGLGYLILVLALIVYHNLILPLPTQSIALIFYPYLAWFASNDSIKVCNGSFEVSILYCQSSRGPTFQQH